MSEAENNNGTSTANLLATARSWFRTAPTGIKVLIAILGWPITLALLPLRIPNRLLRCICLFVIYQGLILAFYFAMYTDMQRSSPEDVIGTIVTGRLVFFGIAAWLVHKSVVKTTTAQGATRKGLAHVLSLLVILLPGVGLTAYANWRYEAGQSLAGEGM